MPSPLDGAALPVTPDRIARLRGFGLSEYAARAYLALLHLGRAEARDVAGLSKVPASKIYHILDQLQEKGLAVVLPEFPRQYAPVPFGDFLRRVHDAHVSAASAIRAEEPTLESMFAVLGDPPLADRGTFTLVRGRRNVLARAAECFAAARADALVLLTIAQARDDRAWRDPVDEALARGVDVRALGGTRGVDARPRPEGLPAAAFALVVDGREALVGLCVPDDGHPTEGNDVALHLDQAGFVTLLRALLDPDRVATPRAVGVPVREANERPAEAAAALAPGGHPPQARRPGPEGLMR